MSVGFRPLSATNGAGNDEHVLSIGPSSIEIAWQVLKASSPVRLSDYVLEDAEGLKASVNVERKVKVGDVTVGVTYEVAAKSKSDLYVSFLPLLTSQMVELVDQPRLIQQIVGLERRTARGGRDTIDDAPGAHDDLANAIAGVVAMLATAKSYDSSLDWVSGPDADAQDAWQSARLWDHIRRYG